MGASLYFVTDRALPSKILATIYLRLSCSEILQVSDLIIGGGCLQTTKLYWSKTHFTE